MRIPSALRLASSGLLGVALLPHAVLAHPGHEGHELTWDLGHLAAHPWATTFWFIVFGASLWSSVQLLRSRKAARATARERREPVSRRGAG